MIIKCFGCDTEIEGDAPNVIADRFMAHTESEHDWQYPESSLRNFAINYAEAIQRQTGSTERLDRIGEISVFPVTEDRVDDWLRFFDHEAFADNPDWGSCYCLEPHEPNEDLEPPWTERRAKMIDRLRNGGSFGYLAYVDGLTAGWVNASLRADYAGGYAAVKSTEPDPSSVVGVSCFVISPPYREHGVASALLDHVIEDAAARGAEWVEGYPINERNEPGASHFFRGPRSMYDGRGFEAIEVRGRDTVMRLAADR